MKSMVFAASVHVLAERARIKKMRFLPIVIPLIEKGVRVFVFPLSLPRVWVFTLVNGRVRVMTLVMSQQTGNFFC